MAESPAPPSPTASSSAGPEGAKSARTTAAMRVLLQVLAGKEPKLDSIESRILYNNSLNIASIVAYLHSHPSEIPAAEVMVVSGAGAQSFSKKKRGAAAHEAELQALNDNPVFDSATVKTFGDVPPLWLGAFLRKHTPEGILDKTVSAMSAKSSKPLRLVLNFFTGLTDKFTIADDLLQKDTLAATLLDFMSQRKDPHERQFFQKSISAEGMPTFIGNDFGCYYFKPRPDQASLVGQLVHSLTGTSVDIGAGRSLQLPMTAVITDNWNDYQAYISVLGGKHFCYKMFAGIGLELKKLGKKDVQALAGDSVCKKQEQEKRYAVQLDSSLQAVAKRRRMPQAPPKAAMPAPAAASE